METLVIIGVIAAIVLALCLYAVLLRVLVVWFAKRNGYTADSMPILYHMVAFGIYFSTLIVVHIAYLTMRTT